MRSTSSVLAFLVALAIHGSTAAQQTKVIRATKLWDGSRLLTDVLVVIDGDRITRIENSSASVPSSAEVIDLRKYTLVPGLIDLHTHMTYYWDRQPGTRPLGQRRRPAVTVFLAQDNARRTLETGVTTVRDLGAANDTDYAMRDLIAMGAMQGPRMIVAGQGISAPRQPAAPNPDAMRTAAEERIKNGSEWVKVYASRGSFDSVDTTQTLTFDELKAIVDVAHATGHKVAIHSYGASGVKDAVRAGADSVEHGIELDEETLADMVKRGTVWVPTIDHNRYTLTRKTSTDSSPTRFHRCRTTLRRISTRPAAP
jgi:imidazolonepropionase-like amidohydrolase